MSIDAIDLIREKIVPLFQKEFDQLEKDHGTCEVFGNEVEGYVNISSDGIRTIQSDVLRVFSQPSYENIGIAQGTFEAPKIPMRFMDYKNAWMLIPTGDEKPEFWVGGKYFEKLSPTFPFIAKGLSGNAALIAMLEDHRAYLAINITPRKELYLNNLLVGDEGHLVICDETGTTIVPRKGWIEFKEAFLALDKVSKTEGLVVLRGITAGRMSQLSDRVQKFYTDNMEFAKLCAEVLPHDPQAKTIWLSAIGAAE